MSAANPDTSRDAGLFVDVFRGAAGQQRHPAGAVPEHQRPALRGRHVQGPHVLRLLRGAATRGLPHLWVSGHRCALPAVASAPPAHPRCDVKKAFGQKKNQNVDVEEFPFLCWVMGYALDMLPTNSPFLAIFRPLWGQK